MEEERYQALVNYIREQSYPAGYSKNQKYILRRACNNFELIGDDQLHYIDRSSDGSIFRRLVIKGKKEVERVFMECHLTGGGHRGRDSTIGKIKSRHYWPNYYKDIEEKVSRQDERLSVNVTSIELANHNTW